MVSTDTPGTVFDKVSMNIMGPLPTTESGHSCIFHDTRFAYQIFIDGATRASNVTGNSRNTRSRKVYQPVYCNRSMKEWITEGPNFINSMMWYISIKYLHTKRRHTDFSQMDR